MEKAQLHILNGDATKEIFSKSQLRGNVLVWREVLVQGPLFYQVDTELFWEMRSQYMEIAYGAKLFEYKRKVIQEFQKLKKFVHGEITLWFEYDLFCQVNMIALLSYILKNKKNCTISLVCVGEFPGKDKLVGLGELNSEDYLKLFAERKTLLKPDLLEADRAWMFFCGKDLRNLDSLQSETFRYLKPALEASKTVFKSPNQLSQLEEDVLEVISKNKFSIKQLIGHLLRNDKILGFGDLQYAHLISGLKKHYQLENGMLILN